MVLRLEKSLFKSNVNLFLMSIKSVLRACRVLSSNSVLHNYLIVLSFVIRAFRITAVKIQSFVVSSSFFNALVSKFKSIDEYFYSVDEFITLLFSKFYSICDEKKSYDSICNSHHYMLALLSEIKLSLNKIMVFSECIENITNGSLDDYKNNCNELLIKKNIIRRPYEGVIDLTFMPNLSNISNFVKESLKLFFKILFYSLACVFFLNKAMAHSFYKSLYVTVINLRILSKFNYVEDNWRSINFEMRFLELKRRLGGKYNATCRLPVKDLNVRVSINNYVKIPEQSIVINNCSFSKKLNKIYVKYLFVSVILRADLDNIRKENWIIGAGNLLKWFILLPNMILSSNKQKISIKVWFIENVVKLVSQPLRFLLESRYLLKREESRLKFVLRVPGTRVFKYKSLAHKLCHFIFIFGNSLLFKIKKLFLYAWLIIAASAIFYLFDYNMFLEISDKIEQSIEYFFDLIHIRDFYDLTYIQLHEILNDAGLLKNKNKIKSLIDWFFFFSTMFIAFELFKIIFILAVVMIFLILTTAIHSMPAFLLSFLFLSLFKVSPGSFYLYTELNKIFSADIIKPIFSIVTPSFYLVYVFLVSSAYTVSFVAYFFINSLVHALLSPIYVVYLALIIIYGLVLSVIYYYYFAMFTLFKFSAPIAEFCFYYNAVVVIALPAVMFIVISMNYFNIGLSWTKKAHISINLFSVISFLITFPYICCSKKKESFVGPLKIEIGSISVNLTEIEINSTSLIFSNMVIIIYSFCSTYAYFYLKKDTSCPKFMFFLTMFTVGMLVIFTAVDLIVVFLGWEIIGLSSFFLISHYNKKTSSLKSGFKAAIFNKLSDYIFIIFIIVYNKSGHSTKINDILMLQDVFARNSIVAFLIIFSFMKSAQIIFNGWLLDSMDAPVPASALIHSATLVVAGIYLSLKFKSVILQSNWIMMSVIICCSFSGLISAAAAVLSTDLKRILANSTISNCSVMFILILFSSENHFCKFLLLHGVLKSLCFLISGVIFVENRHCQDLRYFNNKIRVMSTLFAINCFVLLSSAPFTLMYDVKHSAGNFIHSVTGYNNLKIIFIIFYFAVSTLSIGYGLNFVIRLITLKNNTNLNNVNFDSEDKLTDDSREIFLVTLIYFVFYLIFSATVFNLKDQSTFINVIGVANSVMNSNVSNLQYSSYFVVYVSKIFVIILAALSLIILVKERSNNTLNPYFHAYIFSTLVILLLL